MILSVKGSVFCVTVGGKFTNHDHLTYFRLPFNPSYNKLSQERFDS